MEMGVEKLGCLAVSNPCIMRLSEYWILLAAICVAEVAKLTLQDVSLQGRGLACTLQCPTVNEVQYNAVWKLLLVLIRRVGSLELSEVEALGDALWIRYRGAEDKVPHGVNLGETAFPKLSSY